MAAKKTTKAAKAAKKTDRDALTLTKIEKLAKQVLGQATKGDNPAVDIRTRTLSNVSFNKKKKIIELGDRMQSREFFNTAMARKFMQTMIVAKGCKTLIDEGKTVSIRQMFYMSKHTLTGSTENTFEDQNESYRSSVLGENTVRVGVEAAMKFGWERWLGDRGAFVGMTGFGASGPAEVLYQHFNITAEAIVAAALARL